MTRYAEGTTVSVEASRLEIEKILRRYGATSFAYGTREGMAAIEFAASDRHVRFVLPLPLLAEFRYGKVNQHATMVERTRAQQEKAWEQACRQRWRALVLSIKAKLEAVETDISTFEAEFLAHIVLPNNTTAGEWLAPQIDEAYSTGAMPSMMPALGTGS